jgi:hypothetical protein
VVSASDSIPARPRRCGSAAAGQPDAVENELRGRGVRIVEEWGAMITPTLDDFEAELAHSGVPQAMGGQQLVDARERRLCASFVLRMG